MKFIKTNIRDYINEQSELNNSALNKYDVVMTLEPADNGFHGIGVIERLDNDYVYISLLKDWEDALKYGHDWKRKNQIKISIDNVSKVTSDNIESLSHYSQKRYEIYMNLLKKYLEEK